MTKLTAAQLTEHANFHEGYLSRYIALADAKAAVAFPVNAALLGFLASQDSFRGGLAAANWITAISVAASVAPMVAGALCLWVLIPRRRRSAEGLIFWSAVQAHPDEASFAARLKAMSMADLADARISHCWALTRVAHWKYNWLYWAIAGTALSVLLAVLFFVIAPSTPESSSAISAFF